MCLFCYCCRCCCCCCFRWGLCFFFSNNFVTMTLVGRRILIEMVADENENSKRPANGPLRNWFLFCVFEKCNQNWNVFLYKQEPSHVSVHFSLVSVTHYHFGRHQGDSGWSRATVRWPTTLFCLVPHALYYKTLFFLQKSLIFDTGRKWLVLLVVCLVTVNKTNWLIWSSTKSFILCFCHRFQPRPWILNFWMSN